MPGFSPYQREPPEMAIARGRCPGLRIASAIGEATVSAGSLPADIWTAGGLYTFASAAESLEIVSTSAADTAAGTGLQTVTLVGLDANWREQSQVISLAGLTPVAVPGTWLRVNDMRGSVAGSGQENAGVVVARVAGGGATRSHMAVGAGRALQAVYTIPLDHIGYGTYAAFGLQRKQDAYVEFVLWSRSAGTSGPRIRRNTTTVQSTSPWEPVVPPVPVPFPARTDIWVRAMNASGVDIFCTANLQIILASSTS